MRRLIAIAAFLVALATAGPAAEIGLDIGGTVDYSNYAARLISSF